MQDDLILKQVFKLEDVVLTQFCSEVGARGRTGMSGCSTIENSISLLRSALSMLERIELERGRCSKCGVAPKGGRTTWGW